MAARGELNKNATRILGNFFTSLNVTVGQCMILFYLVWYENKNVLESAAVKIVVVFIGVGIISTAFRLCNARSIISEIESKEPGQR